MQTHSIDGTGAGEPSDERMVAFARRMNPPENEIPVAVPISTVLARTDDLAIALLDVQAYTSGVRFSLAIRLRNEPRGSMRHKTYVMLNAYSGGEESDEQFLLGVEYPDGRTVTNFERPGFPGTPADGAAIAETDLEPRSCGRGRRRRMTNRLKHRRHGSLRVAGSTGSATAGH